MAQPHPRKYYSKTDMMPLDESNKTEFKGHLNLCKEEIPSWALEKKSSRPSRKPISRNLNAFLNSGTGGTVFLGVVDDGKIMGLKMSCSQRDHFLKALDDVFSRYKPKVLPHQYSVHFTPVFNKTLTKDEIRRQLELIPKQEMPEVFKNRKHLLRDCHYCWCDKEAAAVRNLSNTEGHEFVVEVNIHPWDSDDVRNLSVSLGTHIKFQPYYSDEEGKVYFRRQASVVQYSLSSIRQITKQEVKEKYEAEILRLQEQCEQLGKEKAARAQGLVSSSPTKSIAST